MALLLTLQTVFLLALVNFSTCRISKGSFEYLVYPTESLNVSIHSDEQCLDIQWAVHLSAYMWNLKMIFQIDISRTTQNNTVENKNYTTTLKPNESLQWCWHSALPLECTSHFVKIRSMVDDERYPESRIWSPWSPVMESEGQDSSGQFRIFPADIIYAEEGSSVTFCCISGAYFHEKIRFFYEDKAIQGIKLSSHTTMYEVNNVRFVRKQGSNAFCRMDSVIKGVVLYVGVQPQLGEISIENVSATEATLTWKIIPNHKKLIFLCQIEVSHDGKGIEYNTSNSEFTLSGLQTYTVYSVRVRCCTADHFWKWSEWSGKNFTTKEAAPSGALNIWRIVEPVSGGYNVKIFWKSLPPSQANGKILNYSIAMEPLGEVPKVDISFSESDSNSTEKFIDHQPYRISIAAINSVGSSTPSVIVVSGSAENSTQNIKEDRVNGTRDGIYLSWKPKPGETEGYVVDWCNYPRDAICDFQWKKFSPNTTSATIRSAAFQSGVRYNFRIYGLSTKHEAYLLEKKTGYTQELALDCKPEVTVDNLASTSLTLIWKDNCTDEPQYGFFKGYRIYVKPEVGGSCDAETENPAFPGNTVGCIYTVPDTKQKTFNVKKLQPNSTYSFEVKAYTGGGDSLGSIIKVTTGTHENTNLMMTIIFPMAFFSLLLIIGLNLKIQWVKEKCFPDIPDPYKSSVLSLMKFKGNIHQAILNTSDCIPDTIEVVNKPEISKTQGSRTLLMGNEITTPAYLYLLPTGKEALDSQACICFENFTYRQAASDSGSCSQHPMIPTDPARSVEPPEHLLKVERDYIGSLGNIPAGEEASLNYVSQLAPTMSGDKGSSFPDLPEPAHCSEYKMQMVMPTGVALSLPLEGDRPISITSLDQREKPC
ncbi:oncostatin-M-specific receptor subunit beta isoform X2 [Petaurus breviceps papuanus]|uniref:oncostatin-M-specific receptor subunit beta isoform X2 n=1 Tax=Petaurus breviceps papuanus TaxID=3040969 RepID=UPI0036D852BE